MMGFTIEVTSNPCNVPLDVIQGAVDTVLGEKPHKAIEGGHLYLWVDYVDHHPEYGKEPRHTPHCVFVTLHRSAA